MPAHGVAVFLRRGHPDAQRADRLGPQRGRDPPFRGSRFAGLPVAGLAAQSRGRRPARILLCLLHGGLSDGADQYRGVDRGAAEEAVAWTGDPSGFNSSRAIRRTLACDSRNWKATLPFNRFLRPAAQPSIRSSSRLFSLAARLAANLT